MNVGAVGWKKNEQIVCGDVIRVRAFIREKVDDLIFSQQSPSSSQGFNIRYRLSVRLPLDDKDFFFCMFLNELHVFALDHAYEELCQ